MKDFVTTVMQEPYSCFN